MESQTGEKMSEQEEFEFRLRLEQEQKKPEAPLSDKKPLIRSLLPESLGSLFPSEKEAAPQRAARGLDPTPKEPVPEYSPAEEMALGSAVGAPAASVARGVLSNPLLRRIAKYGAKRAAEGVGLYGAYKFFGGR
jgi:hypothetical protein